MNLLGFCVALPVLLVDHLSVVMVLTLLFADGVEVVDDGRVVDLRLPMDILDLDDSAIII